MDYRFDYKLFFAQPSPKGDHTGTGKLGDTKRFEQVQKCFDFVFIPRRLDDQAGGSHIDYFSAKNIAYLSNFWACFGVGIHFEQYQLSSHCLIPMVIFHLDDIDQLVQLLNTLIEGFLISIKSGSYSGTAI